MADRDSLGSVGTGLITRSEPSRSLATSLQKFRSQTGETITAAQLTDQLTRLNAVFGSPKDRNMDQIRVMANEWLKALRAFGVQTVHRATTKCIQESKWWPALAEVVALCRADEDGWRDALGIKDERRHHAEPVAFAKDGRTEAEEIIFRAAQVASMKREAGLNSDAAPEVFSRPEKNPASQSMIVTPQARNSCAARRARHEETCEPSCFRQHCSMRDAEAARGGPAIDSQSPPTGSDDFSDPRPRPESEAAQ